MLAISRASSRILEIPVLGVGGTTASVTASYRMISGTKIFEKKIVYLSKVTCD